MGLQQSTSKILHVATSISSWQRHVRGASGHAARCVPGVTIDARSRPYSGWNMTANQLIPDMSRPITSIVTPGPVHRPSLSDKGRHLQFQSWSTLPRVCRSRVPPGFIFRSCPPHLHILVPRGGASFPGGGGWEEVEDRTADSAPALACGSLLSHVCPQPHGRCECHCPAPMHPIVAIPHLH